MLNILIADDESFVRSGLKYLLDWEELGFQICGEAANGLDTLNSISRLQPDLILLDIHMPKMDGLEVVKQAQMHNFTGKFIILSGYSEFKYAQKAMQYGVNYYLTKPIDEEALLQAVCSIKELLQKERQGSFSLKQYKEKARTTILRDLLLDSQIDLDTLDLDEFHLSSTCYQVILCEHYNQTVTHPSYCFSDLLRLSNQGSLTFETIFLNEKEVLLLKSLTTLERFYKILMHYHNKPQKGSPLDHFFISYGRVVYHPKEIYHSYQDALTLLKRRFFCKQEQHAIGYTEVVTDCFYEISSSAQEEYSKTFVAYIQTGNQRLIVSSLEELSQSLYHTTSDLTQVVNFLVEIALQVIHRLSIPNPNLSYPSNAELIDFMKSRFYLYEIIAYLKELFEKLRNQIGNFTSNAVLEDVIHYIKLNYKENIHLESIAPIFGYNSSYLGKLFSKKTGTTFNTYLDRIRLNHSLELLADESLKVYEIAEQVGYKNVDYFHKKFKKYFGESPIEYRKNNLMKERVKAERV